MKTVQKQTIIACPPQWLPWLLGIQEECSAEAAADEAREAAATAASSAAAAMEAAAREEATAEEGTEAAVLATATTPFYAIAHMCNQIDAVNWAMKEGANAVEIDLNFKSWKFEHGAPCDCTCLTEVFFGKHSVCK